MAQRCTRRFAVCLMVLGGVLGAGSARGQIPEWFGTYRTAADFALRDVLSQRTIKLSDYFNPEAKTRNVVVLAFTGVDCPIGDLYMPRLGGAGRDVQEQGGHVSGDQFQRARHGRASGRAGSQIQVAFSRVEGSGQRGGGCEPGRADVRGGGRRQDV